MPIVMSTSKILTNNCENSVVPSPKGFLNLLPEPAPSLPPDIARAREGRLEVNVKKSVNIFFITILMDW